MFLLEVLCRSLWLVPVSTTRAQQLVHGWLILIIMPFLHQGGQLLITKWECGEDVYDTTCLEATVLGEKDLGIAVSLMLALLFVEQHCCMEARCACKAFLTRSRTLWKGIHLLWTVMGLVSVRSGDFPYIIAFLKASSVSSVMLLATIHTC